MRIFEAREGRYCICRLNYEADLIHSNRLQGKKISPAFSMLGAGKNAKICVYNQEEKKYMDKSASASYGEFTGRIHKLIDV